jgi:ABC-type sugar transport system ATPase subunit
MTDTILRMSGITKTFPGVKALQDVNLEVGRPVPRTRRPARSTST